MSGHNRWAKVKHVKAKTDAVKGKVFSKLIKEIVVAAKSGGDPTTNAALRTLIAKAREANMPQDTVKKAIQRGTGELPGVSFEEMRYEGYGPGGVALVVDVLTDNKNKAASEVRYIFDRFHGKFGTPGSVAWKFDRRSLFYFKKETVTEEKLMEIALEAGADDIRDDGDSWLVVADPAAFDGLKAAFDGKSLVAESAEVTMLPQETVKLDGEDARRMLSLMEKLEENDEVQNVYANFDIDDKVMEQME